MADRGDAIKRALLILLVAAVAIAGCESLKYSKPIIPLAEYERILVGRLDANYVGNNTCLSACHFHDKVKRDFEASTMGAQLSPKSGMPLVDCESCHGPGSLAVEGITPEAVAAAAAEGKELACNYETFIGLGEIPKQAQSLLCLKCHTANATFNLHAWNMGAHALGDVSCFDCHNIHAGPDLIVSPMDTADMCFKCHQKSKAEFSLPSHHPVKDMKLFCTDCHDSHGTFNDFLLRKATIKDTCVSCHAEKAGPFTYEHADLNDDCLACHSQHGSVNNGLLKVREPFLCLQCHAGHRTSSASSSLETKGAFYTRCTDCHSQVHGTDLPSSSGRGLFTN